MRYGWLLLLLILAVPLQAEARSRYFGDEDPYPLACMNFSGHWKSDEGENLKIEQGDRCRWLKLTAAFDSNEGATTIVPDDKARIVHIGKWRETIRYRWNNKQFATVIETHREIKHPDHTVTELVLLEKVNSQLLLESTYRTTEYGSGEQCEPVKEYFQRVFRLVGGAAGRSRQR